MFLTEEQFIVAVRLPWSPDGDVNMVDENASAVVAAPHHVEREDAIGAEVDRKGKGKATEKGTGDKVDTKGKEKEMDKGKKKEREKTIKREAPAKGDGSAKETRNHEDRSPDIEPASSKSRKRTAEADPDDAPQPPVRDPFGLLLFLCAMSSC